MNADGGFVQGALMTMRQVGDHPVAPLAIVAVVADAAVCLLAILKLLANIVEARWFLGPGGERLRTRYMHSYHKGDLPRTYEADIAYGRPRLFTQRLEAGTARSALLSTFGYIFKAPAVILISAVASLAVGTWAPAPVGIITASLIAGVVLFMLVNSLLGRLVLGPFDQLNPDLAIGKAVQKRIYPASSPLGIYVLALIIINIVGFTAIYANIAHAVPGAFTGNQSVDPIQWLYFASTIASTVGFGDLHAVSDTGRVFVLMQLLAGSLLLTWVAMVFFGESLPPKDPQWSPAESAMPRSGNSGPPEPTNLD